MVYIFDTDVTSDILFENGCAFSLLKKLQEEDGCTLLISEITRAEILSISGITSEMEQEFDCLVECFDDVISVDEFISRKAGELRRMSNREAEKCTACGKRTAGKLKIPDAIIAATAVTEDAILITRNIKDYSVLSENRTLQARTPEVALMHLETNQVASSQQD